MSAYVIGIDFGGLLRAAYVTLIKKGEVQGGSTLTQQLIVSRRDIVSLSRDGDDKALFGEIVIDPRCRDDAYFQVSCELAYRRELFFLGDGPVKYL